MKTQKRILKRHPLTLRWMIWDATNHMMISSFETKQQAADALQHFNAFAVGSKAMLPNGTRVMCNGYPGVIFAHFDQDQYEIRLKSGLVCTDDFRLIDESYWTEERQEQERIEYEQAKAGVAVDHSQAGNLADA